MLADDPLNRRLSPANAGRALLLLFAGVWVIVLNNARIADNLPQELAYSLVMVPRVTRAIEAAVVLGAFALLQPRLGRSRLSSLNVALWLFIALAVLGGFRQPTSLGVQLHGTYVYVAPFLVYALAWVAAPTRRTVHRLGWLVGGYLVASVIVALVLQLPTVREKGDLIHGLLSDAHAFGTYLALACCVAFTWFLGRGGLGFLTLAVAAFLVSYFPANEKAIVFTLLWCGTTTGIRLLRRPASRRGLLAAFGALVLLGGLLLSPGRAQSWLRLEQLERLHFSDVGPVRAATSAIAAIADSPGDLVFGLGPGNFAGVAALSAARANPVSSLSLSQAAREVQRFDSGAVGAAGWATNAWSNLLAEFGVAGSCLFALLLAAVFGPLVAWHPADRHGDFVRLVVFGMLGLVVWQGIFTPYTSWAEPVLVYPMMALAAYAARQARRDAYPRRLAAGPRRTVTTDPGVPSPSPRREVWYLAVTDFPLGMGSTARARSISRALSMAGFTVRLLIPYALGHGQNEVVSGTADGTVFEYLGGSPRRPSTALGIVLAKARGNIHVFERAVAARRRLACIAAYNATLLDCWGALLAGRLFGIPVVLDLSDDWHDPSLPIQALGRARYLFQRFALATERILYRRMAAVIVVSRRLHERAAPYAAATIMCPAVFDASPFITAPPERLADAGDFEILYAGSVSRTEGVHLLIDAVRRVRVDLRVRLFVVGNPAHNETIEEYRALAGDLAADGTVTFLPGVDRQRYASLLRGADLLVIPRPTSSASSAGFPYKLLDFLASGTPLVVTRFGDVAQYFSDGVHCVTCAPDDAAELAGAIGAVVRRPHEARAIAYAGQQRVSELFSMQIVAAQLGQLVGDLAGTRRAKP